MIFEEDYGVDNSPPDDTQITTTLLYYSEEELAEFKKLCKKGMLIELGDARFKGNVSNFILQLLRKQYDDNRINGGANSETAQ